MSGLFITMEGTDGAGKTTQIKMLEKYLTDKGFQVVCTREPGGNKISEKIRDIIIDVNNNEITDMTETLLYAAARAQIVKEVIEPALKEGAVVICDRFVDSSVVYQGIARGLGEKVVKNINRYATDGLEPDLTFFIKLKPEDGIARKEKQAELDRIESEEFYFHKRVYDGYMRISKRNKNRIKTINGLKSIEEIHADIVDKLEQLLNERSF